MEDKKEDKSNEINKTEPIQELNKPTEQFCSCCKPVDFFDFLNNKNKDMLCVDIFSNNLCPETSQANGIKKAHGGFIKKQGASHR
jgi:hypothetical protein